VTAFYHWSPRDAFGLTLDEIEWWHKQAVRIARNRRG
jgi:hypothetical protein